MGNYINILRPGYTSGFVDATASFLDHNDRLIKAKLRYPDRLTSGQSRHTFGLASLQHETGKSWESAFIPIDVVNRTGMSITWWNRRAGLPGEVNIKFVAHYEWEKVVVKKIKDGNYRVVNAVMSKMAQVSRLMEEGGVPDDTLVNGFSYEYGIHPNDIPTDVAGRIALAVKSAIWVIENSPQFRNFFDRLDAKGHKYRFNDSSLIPLVNGCMTEYERQNQPQRLKLIMDATLRIGEYIQGKAANSSSSTTSSPVEVTPVKATTMADRYSAWGSFG